MRSRYFFFSYQPHKQIAKFIYCVAKKKKRKKTVCLVWLLNNLISNRPGENKTRSFFQLKL